MTQRVVIIGATGQIGRRAWLAVPSPLHDLLGRPDHAAAGAR